MIKQGEAIGVHWAEQVATYEKQQAKLDDYYSALLSSKVVLPAYYLQPFHAYDEGNLSWQAAMEVGSAALTVHANIYTPDRKTLEAQGDDKLRSRFHDCMRQAIEQNGRGFVPKRIIDVGCSTGISTLKLAESFPEAEVIGIDLSAFMLSVAKLDLETKKEARGRITYLYAAAEATSLGEGDVDMVAMSLVSHELPAEASIAAFKEAYNILPSGGCLSLMDMDPNSASFQALACNPFAFTAFKSTEPWLTSYMGLSLEEELINQGFVDVSIRINSPRHRTVVAWKR